MAAKNISNDGIVMKPINEAISASDAAGAANARQGAVRVPRLAMYTT